jgi:hypothetical protein
VARPWIFFVSSEEVFDQTEFEAYLNPGVDLRVCVMPRQQRKFRPSAFGDRLRQPNQQEIRPDLRLVDGVEPEIQTHETEPVFAREESDAAPQARPSESDPAPRAELIGVNIVQQMVEPKTPVDKAPPLAVLVAELPGTIPASDEDTTAPIEYSNAQRLANDDLPVAGSRPPRDPAPVRAWQALVAGLSWPFTKLVGAITRKQVLDCSDV